MVTWSFDLLALSIGFVVGLLLGGILVLSIEMRDNGAWSKGFFEGCEKNALISYLENEKERMHNRAKSSKEVSGDACCCADGEKDGSQIKRPQKTFWDSLSEADLMEPMHHFEE